MKTIATFGFILLATGFLLLAGCTRSFPETDSILWELQALSSDTISSSVTSSYNANGIAIEGSTSIFTSESGTVQQFGVFLLQQPTADVMLPVNVSDSTEELISTDGSTYTASLNLTFTSASWDQPQTVYVKGQDDAIADGNIISTIITGTVVSADTYFNGFNPADLPAVNFDNDSAMGAYGIAVAPTGGLYTSESGRTAEFALMLQGQPSSDVMIGLSSSNPAEGLVSPTAVTFTSSNWNQPVVATITGQDDLVVDGDINYSIVTAPATSSDPNYSGMNAADVSVTNLDNDTNGVSMGGGALTTYEDQGQPPAQFQVVLTQQPTDVVKMNLVSSDTTEGLVSLDNITYSASLSITFNSGNYSSPVIIYVKGVDDTIKDGNVPYSIMTSFNTTDPYYNSTNPPDVQVTNIDND